MTGSLTLSEYPGDLVRLSCEKCGRAGQYRKQTLIERYGADMRLPDLREEIAQCSRMGQMHDACMVRYAELVPLTKSPPRRSSGAGEDQWNVKACDWPSQQTAYPLGNDWL